MALALIPAWWRKDFPERVDPQPWPHDNDISEGDEESESHEEIESDGSETSFGGYESNEGDERYECGEASLDSETEQIDSGDECLGVCASDSI